MQPIRPMRPNSSPLSRRRFLSSALGGAATLAVAGPHLAMAAGSNKPSWSRGSVRHLLPTINHQRLLLKASFDRPLSVPPVLRAGGRTATGVRLDTAGEFYSFDIAN